MTFNTILINFDSEKEQKNAEMILPLSVWEHDTEELWTEFDISGCDPDDLSRYFSDPQLIVDDYGVDNPDNE